MDLPTVSVAFADEDGLFGGVDDADADADPVR